MKISIHDPSFLTWRDENPSRNIWLGPSCIKCVFEKRGRMWSKDEVNEECEECGRPWFKLVDRKLSVGLGPGMKWREEK